MIDYYLLTKPGILLGNLVPFAAGFLLASKGSFNPWLFIVTVIGLTLIMASSCVFNNYINRHVDKKMERTKKRALVTGLISARHAIIYAVILGLAGFVLLYTYTNVLTVAVAALGFFVYVVLYSILKGHTIYGTAIGSVSGAVPPIVGYCAVSNQLDAGAWVLFAMLVLWQMPHFFAIAVYHFDDYKKAELPLLPIVKGMMRTKIQMMLYIAAFLVASLLLTAFEYTGYVYLGVAMSVGLAWLGLCVKGFSSEDDQLWGRRMFQMSLVVIMAICFVIPLDRA